MGKQKMVRVNNILGISELKWMERVNLTQLTIIPTTVSKNPLKEMKKAKWLSGEAFQIAVKRREAKSKGEKERYKHLNVEFQRITRRDKKSSSEIIAKK